VLIIVAIKFVAPDTYDAGKDKILEILKIKTAETKDKVVEATTDYVENRTEEILEEFLEEPVVDEDEPLLRNECGEEFFGYPDYYGTNKQGDTCADYIDGDLECISSPPLSYDGEISLLYKTSNPEITCCVADGTCQW
jgi:hypothetical protein